MKTPTLLSLALTTATTTTAFTVAPNLVARSTTTALQDIVSPFDNTSGDNGDVATYTPTDPVELEEGPLDLTEENVEKVLDEMRPFLIQDGGNVAITEIDGPVVRLELQVRTICV